MRLALPVIAREWLLRQDPTPHTSPELGSCVDVMPRDGMKLPALSTSPSHTRDVTNPKPTFRNVEGMTHARSFEEEKAAADWSARDHDLIKTESRTKRGPSRLRELDPGPPGPCLETSLPEPMAFILL
ncbi:hypothetical protein TNCV_2013111 [Trichonephila clavipes]|nr:hypothetical protein TNCV_2013111 [Trichonephila clavipes]